MLLPIFHPKMTYFVSSFKNSKKKLRKLTSASELFVRCTQFKLQVNFFFGFFLHHLIELELLITNIYFLALVNASFRPKNTKYWKNFFSLKNHIFFENQQNFLLYSFFQLFKIIFSDWAWKTDYRQVVKSTLDTKLYWWWRFESGRVSCV